MPLVLWAAIAVVAGLLAGFGAAGAWACAAAAVVVAAQAAGVGPRLTVFGAAAAGRMTTAALALAVAASALIGAATVRRAAACLDRLERLHEWDVILGADPAQPGSLAHGTVRASGCAAPVSMTVMHGEAPAGARVIASGAAVATDRGLMIQRAAIRDPEFRDLFAVLRARAGRTIDTLFRGDAPLVRALLIADMRAVPTEMRDRFAAAGIVHMLSISGLHVAIIATALHLLLGALRTPRGVQLGLTLAITAAYVAMIGAPAPAVRSAVMLTLGGASERLQRPTSPWAPLAVGALIPLALDPAQVLDLGWQLSVGGMAGLIASGALVKRILSNRWRGWRRQVAREMIAATVATAITAPLIAWYFGRLSLVAPITNLAAGPVVGVLQPTLFLAMVLAPFDGPARFVAAAAHPMLIAFDGIASVGAALPGASVTMSPSLAVAVLGGAAAVAGIVACVSRWPARPAAVALACVAGMCWLPFLPPATGPVELHMIDVGQGDAVALRTPHGQWIVVDAGRDWPGGDAGRTTVVPYLRRRGGAVALFILSHAHADHAGGAATLVDAMRPAEFWDGAFAGTSDSYRKSLLTAQRAGVRWRRVHPGDSLVIDGVRLDVLAPDSAWMAGIENVNETSVIVRATIGEVRFLLTGDAERAEEAWLVANAGDRLTADVLKVGHHGSRTSTGPALLARVQPRVALVSVGKGNKYGHPSPETLRALVDAGVQVLRTDDGGSIVVRTDGHRLEVEAHGERWVPARGGASP